MVALFFCVLLCSEEARVPVQDIRWPGGVEHWPRPLSSPAHPTGRAAARVLPASADEAEHEGPRLQSRADHGAPESVK